MAAWYREQKGNVMGRRLIHSGCSELTLLSKGLALAAAALSLVACADEAGEDGIDLAAGQVSTLQQQLLTAPFGFRQLSREPVPQPTNGHIVDQAAAIRLGKVLFWDIQAGSDGQVACAVCHSTAGSDARRVNTLHPGFDGV
jgi:cytochrome c peroxidase